MRGVQDVRADCASTGFIVARARSRSTPGIDPASVASYDPRRAGALLEGAEQQDAAVLLDQELGREISNALHPGFDESASPAGQA